MLRSDAENFLEMWSEGESKIFRYLRPLVPNEYVVYRKSNLGSFVYEYEPEPTKSTYTNLKKMDHDKFLKAVANEELIYVRPWTWQSNTREMKTGGCTCGSWAVRESERIHDRKCPLGRMF